MTTADESALFDVILGRLDDADIGSVEESGDDAEEMAAAQGLWERLRHGARTGASERYQREGIAGRGGMGDVLRVYDRELERDLAMKVVRAGAVEPHTSGVPAILEMKLLTEARLTSQLHHPGIVPVHEVGVDHEDRPFFTMQLVEGRDLAAILEEANSRESEPGRGEASWSRTRLLQTLLRAAEAVSFAHSKSILHRDLKPANIMVGEFGEVYVMDWGLALRVSSPLGDESRRSAVAGTPSYMSPEQAQGQSDVDARSDVYSLGAILYHILGGHAPYREGAGQSSQSVLRALRHGAPAPLPAGHPSVPAELIAICEKAMEREPAARYESAREFVIDLRAYLEGRVVSAHRVGPLVELAKWVQRNRRFAAALGALLVSLLVGLTVTTHLFMSLQAERKDLLVASIYGLEVRHRHLLDTEPNLWPPAPDRVADLRTWLDEAARVAADVSRLRGQLVGALGPEFEHGALTTLEGRVKALVDPKTGLVAGAAPKHGMGVAKRLEIALRIERNGAPSSGTPGSVRPELVPLGPDPDSGLNEFAHVGTGAVPTRNAVTSKLELTPECSLVFVEIPGGRGLMGASPDPASEHFDPLLVEGATVQYEALTLSEGPVQQVKVETFFLSKYEVTQAQWLRWTAERPSETPTGNAALDEARRGALHPVEHVSWLRSQEVLNRMGLRLPTEIEWEFSTRAGTRTPWSMGLLKDLLASNANLLDRAGYAIESVLPLMLDYDDGWPVHAPVDRGPQNPFGLVHVHGNVAEWCSDFYRHYGRTLPPGAGLKRAVFRGGSFLSNNPATTRSSYRGKKDLNGGDTSIGLRPALSRTR